MLFIAFSTLVVPTINASSTITDPPRVKLAVGGGIILLAVIVLPVPETERLPLSVASPISVDVSFTVNRSVITRPVKVGFMVLALNAKAISISDRFAFKSSAACVAPPIGMPLTVPEKVVFPVTVKLPPTLSAWLHVTGPAE